MKGMDGDEMSKRNIVVRMTICEITDSFSKKSGGGGEEYAEPVLKAIDKLME